MSDPENNSPNVPVRRALRTPEMESTRILLMRFIALMCGMEHICRLRACRKSNRCLGDKLECWSDHSGLLRRRFELAMRDHVRRNAPTRDATPHHHQPRK